MSVLIGLVIGLVLGLTGAGGSIFAVPLLMLLLGLPINDAIGIALGAVAVSAFIGTLSNWRAQYILWVPAIALGLGGALVAPIGKNLGAQLPPLVLLVGFCALAFIIAGIMWRQTITAPERSNVLPVLIDLKITKADCYQILLSEGIKLPRVYSQGYPNANCIGCVKATSPTYWNHVRTQNEEVFNQRSKQSREIGAKLVRYKGQRIFLDELPTTAKGNPMKNLDVECGIFCEERFND